ncbi:MAG TPA: DUF4337 domain-containing protein [Nitrospirota bacterium]|nr:DUF4337 domain-containing protein [Nitrospirota bacterium]
MAEVELPKPEELEEVRAKSFTRTVALTTALFAVLLAITSLGGNNAAKEMLLSQQQASDQWAFYQSKVLREHLDNTNRLLLELNLFERSATMKPAAKEHYRSLIRELRAEEARYGEEKKDIEREAKHLEEDRDKNLAKDPYFNYAEVLLQISIVLASISILAVSRPVYSLAICSASLGFLMMLNGYLLLFKIPFFH